MFKIYISTIFSMLCCTLVVSQNLYNPTSIKEIRLSFNEKDWDKRLDSLIRGE